MQTPFGAIPSLQELLSHPTAKRLLETASPQKVADQVRQFLGHVRASAEAAASTFRAPQPGEWIDRFAHWLRFPAPIARRAVVNATGALLGEPLGPPPLADEAIRAQAAAASCYHVEGARTNEPTAAERALARLAGAEDALIVHRVGAARSLIATALAPGRAIVVARRDVGDTGEELGWPAAIEAAGGRAMEVGTSAGAAIPDFTALEKASPAAWLKCETPTLAVVGRVAAISVAEFAMAAHASRSLAIGDLGWGGLWSLERFGLAPQPTLGDYAKAGFDAVVASGAGWLGGPTCGIVCGKAATIAALRAHPTWPAVRPDAATIAAVEATLRLYEDESRAEHAIPLLSLVATSPDNLKQRAERMALRLGDLANARVAVVEVRSAVVGVDLPGMSLPGHAVTLTPTGSAVELAKSLESNGLTPRVDGDGVRIDLRSVLPSQDVRLIEIVREAVSPSGSSDS